MQLESQRLVCAAGEAALLVHQGKEARVLVQKDVQDVGVVGVVNGIECHALPGALFDLPLEDVLVEIKLQLLISNVDADLNKYIEMHYTYKIQWNISVFPLHLSVRQLTYLLKTITLKLLKAKYSKPILRL